MSQTPQSPQSPQPQGVARRQIVGAGAGGVGAVPPPVALPGGPAPLPTAGALPPGVPLALAAAQAMQSGAQAAQGPGSVSQQGLYRLECGRCSRLLGLASPGATVSLVCGRCKGLNLIVVPLYLKAT